MFDPPELKNLEKQIKTNGFSDMGSNGSQVSRKNGRVKKVEGKKGGKQWVKTDVTKWVKANAKPEPKVVKLEPKEQAKAEADDAQVLGIMKDETVIRPAFHKRLIDYIMKWFKR